MWVVWVHALFPQVPFLIAYHYTDIYSACGIMFLVGCVTLVCLVAAGKKDLLIGKLILLYCAGLTYWLNDVLYFQIWVTVFALHSGIRDILFNKKGAECSDIYDEKIKLPLGAVFLIYTGLLVIAEIARRVMELDVWIWFQYLFPASYIGLTVLLVTLLLRNRIMVKDKSLAEAIRDMEDKGK